MKLQKTYKYKTKALQQKKVEELKDYKVFTSDFNNNFCVHLQFTRKNSKINYIKRG